MSETGSVQLVRGTVVTMNDKREIIADGAVAIEHTHIVEAGGFDELLRAHPEATVSGSASDLVVPGYVNGHQHLTGDRLFSPRYPMISPLAKRSSPGSCPCMPNTRVTTTNSPRHSLSPNRSPTASRAPSKPERWPIQIVLQPRLRR